MNRKNVIIYGLLLVLSVVVTYGAAMLDFVINKTKTPTGLPFGFSTFNFLGGNTDQLMLILDIIFWFVVILLAWKLIQKLIRRN